jgi:hypothetical protein
MTATTFTKARLGATFHHSFQPFDEVFFTIESITPVVADASSPDYIKVRAERGMMTIAGTITKGTRVSRIGGHRSFQDLTGRHSVDVTPRELEDLRRVEMACG